MFKTSYWIVKVIAFSLLIGAIIVALRRGLTMGNLLDNFTVSLDHLFFYTQSVSASPSLYVNKTLGFGLNDLCASVKDLTSIDLKEILGIHDAESISDYRNILEDGLRKGVIDLPTY